MNDYAIGPERGALDGMSDASNLFSQVRCLQHVRPVCHDYPCPMTPRACSGQSNCSAPPETLKLEETRKVQKVAEASHYELDMDSRAVDMDCSLGTVRSRPAARPDALRIDCTHSPCYFPISAQATGGAHSALFGHHYPCDHPCNRRLIRIQAPSESYLI